MQKIPLRTFEGFLKQITFQRLNPIEQELFEFLFPCYLGKLEPGKTVHELDEYSISHDEKGNDRQTLAYKLRAFRDPVTTGLVEVIDLADGYSFQIKKEHIRFSPEPAIAVLIHEFEILPEKLQKLEFKCIPGLKDQPVHLYRFPYTVKHQTLKDTLDLRFPDAREWFFQMFKVPDIPLENEDVTTVYSRFHLEKAKPPAPSEFWSMLPTLINPDLGNGKLPLTQSTLIYIAYQLRLMGCAALISPSAGADVSVTVEQSNLKDFSGWNLIFFVKDSFSDLMPSILSPWPWVRFPEGAALSVDNDKTIDTYGFTISGITDYWRKDHQIQIQALETTRHIYGRETGRGGLPVLSISRSLMIGVLAIRWMRFVLKQLPAEKVSYAVLEFIGLTLPLGLYHYSGRIQEIWEDVRKKGYLDPESHVKVCADIAAQIAGHLSHKLSRSDLSRILMAGFDLEYYLLFLQGLLRRDRKNLSVPRLSGNLHQCLEFGVVLIHEIETFYLQTTTIDMSMETIEDVVATGQNLINRIYNHLKLNEAESN